MQGRSLRFTVPGEPVVQPRGKPVRRGAHVAMVSAHASHPVWMWRDRIKAEARRALCVVPFSANPEDFAPPIQGPLVLSVLFVTPFTGQPKKTKPNPRRWNEGNRDLDNFLKPLKDALTEAGVWMDDKQVVAYGRMAKVRAAFGEHPHTVILIESAGDPWDAAGF